MSTMTKPMVALDEIARFYDGKTRAVLERYGPGPRVHYHAGLFYVEEPLASAPGMLKRQLVESQDRLMRHAATVWDAGRYLSGEVLDAGCGLGGGSVMWAQDYGARVTAVTCAASHIDLIERFALEAGVGGRVRPLLHNVVALPGRELFDAAVAIESSCHMPRGPLFARLAALAPFGRPSVHRRLFLRGSGLRTAVA
jgi:tocopherol O-methyltransferase